MQHTRTQDTLVGLFVAAGIELDDCEAIEFAVPGECTGRGFPVTGGVAAAVRAHLDPGVALEPVVVDGLDRKAIKLLASYAKNGCPGNLVEVMSCEGGCVAGPCVIGKPAAAARRVQQFAAGNAVTAGKPSAVPKPEKEAAKMR